MFPGHGVVVHQRLSNTGKMIQLSGAFSHCQPHMNRLHTLDMSSAKVVGFSDAFLNTNVDNTTELGYTTFIKNGLIKSVPIHFKSYKTCHIVQSVLEDALIALTNIFDTVIARRTKLTFYFSLFFCSIFYGQSVFIYCNLKEFQLEQGSILDIACARKSFSHHESFDTVFLQPSNDISEALTTRMQQARRLDSVNAVLEIEPSNG